HHAHRVAFGRDSDATSRGGRPRPSVTGFAPRSGHHPLEGEQQMPINPEAVGTSTGNVTSSWSSKDCILYALGVGAGMPDPTGFELEFTTENTAGVSQRVLPTFAVAAAWETFGGGSALASLGPYE